MNARLVSNGHKTFFFSWVITCKISPAGSSRLTLKPIERRLCQDSTFLSNEDQSMDPDKLKESFKKIVPCSIADGLVFYLVSLCQSVS